LNFVSVVVVADVTVFKLEKEKKMKCVFDCETVYFGTTKMMPYYKSGATGTAVGAHPQPDR
jgi:hypothetical protein